MRVREVPGASSIVSPARRALCCCAFSRGFRGGNLRLIASKARVPVPGLSSEIKRDGRRTEDQNEGRDREENEEGSRSAGVLGTQRLETFNCTWKHRGIVLSLSLSLSLSLPRMIHGHSSGERCVQNSRVVPFNHLTVSPLDFFPRDDLFFPTTRFATRSPRSSRTRMFQARL